MIYILSLLLPLTFAQSLKTEAEIPAQINEFMNQLRQNQVQKGADLILWEWQDKAAMAKQMVDGDKTNRQRLGKMMGHEILKTCKIGKFLQKLQVIAKYERGYVHWSFDYYNPGNGWK